MAILKQNNTVVMISTPKDIKDEFLVLVKTAHLVELALCLF